MPGFKCKLVDDEYYNCRECRIFNTCEGIQYYAFRQKGVIYSFVKRLGDKEMKCEECKISKDFRDRFASCIGCEELDLAAEELQQLEEE